MRLSAAARTLRLPPAGPSFGRTPNDGSGDASAALLRTDSEGPPRRLYPFKRPAGVQWPTATSNPKPPVAAHGRSWLTASPLDQNPVGIGSSRGTAILHLQVCPKIPRKMEGVQPLGAGALLGTFPAWEKYPRGAGLRKPSLTRIEKNRPRAGTARRFCRFRPHSVL